MPGGRYCLRLPAEVLWGSFVTHSNEPQRTSAGRLVLPLPCKTASPSRGSGESRRNGDPVSSSVSKTVKYLSGEA